MGLAPVANMEPDAAFFGMEGRFYGGGLPAATGARRQFHVVSIVENFFSVNWVLTVSSYMLYLSGEETIWTARQKLLAEIDDGRSF